MILRFQHLFNSLPGAEIGNGKRRIIGTILVTAATLALTADAKAASNLRPETVAAWNHYVAAADNAMQNRVCESGSFLWTFENAERAARVRKGEIEVAPAPGPNPRRVPNGLVHHWIGAAFLPHVKLDDVLRLTRDYDHYKDVYTPYVVASKTNSRSATDDNFSMRLMNKSLFLKFALDADYHATVMRVDEHRAYSITGTSRVQEIEDYGEPAEHALPEGHGGGYIWKLHSISRLEERDGGVYIELEALVLSRDIPLAFRFAVEPVVRRVSRSSLLTSLQQTADALHRVCEGEMTLTMAMRSCR
ncbi:MAG TPA: hypothetical protein VGL72_00800 [Bryobacteraceae bacterium]